MHLKMCPVLLGMQVQLIMTVIHTKTKQKWAFSKMMAVVKYHLTAYIDLGLFLENPNQKWEVLTTKFLTVRWLYFEADTMLFENFSPISYFIDLY